MIAGKSPVLAARMIKRKGMYPHTMDACAATALLTKMNC
jgi:hypothetical protein